MRFEPVFLSKPLDRRVSQTMLRHSNLCRRSGFLYAETKGSAQTVEMMRGSCSHAIKERATNEMLSQGEPTIPPDLVKVIVDEALEEFPVPIEEHDYLREESYRWAEQFAINPADVVCVERLIVLEIEGWHVRMKIDFAEVSEDGRRGYVGDYKSGRGAPPSEKIARKRPDGTLAAKNFQLILYALGLVYGKPVRVEAERCPACATVPETAMVGLCATCGGRGVVRSERIEPFPIAPHLQEAILEFIYPGVEIKSGEDAGKMLRQTLGLTRMEIDAYRESLVAIVRSVARAEESGEWPAIVSDDACDICPCKPRCPIPVEMRDHRGEINSERELREAAEIYYLEGKVRTAKRREIKATAKALGGPRARVRFGKDRVWELGDVIEATEVDKDGLFAAVERAVQFGEPFERSDFVKTSKSTPFSERALSDEELEAETAGQEAQA